MNIFEKNIGGLLGRFDGKPTVGSLQKFFFLSGEIRAALGRKGYLLDNYLSMLLAVANSTLAHNAAMDGLEIAVELRRLCKSILENRNEFRAHPFYEQALNTLLAHEEIREPQEEDTQVCLLMILLADGFLSLAAERFLEEAGRRMGATVDTVCFRQLYDQISLIVGEPTMEKLNLCLKQRFLTAPLVLVFLQGVNNDLVSTLAAQDKETGKQMFQLAADVVGCS